MVTIPRSPRVPLNLWRYFSPVYDINRHWKSWLFYKEKSRLSLDWMKNSQDGLEISLNLSLRVGRSDFATVITEEQKETWFYSLFATWYNSYCFIFRATLVPATTFRPSVSICGGYSGITQCLLSRHVTTLVTPLLLSFNLIPRVFFP